MSEKKPEKEPEAWVQMRILLAEIRAKLREEAAK